MKLLIINDMRYHQILCIGLLLLNLSGCEIARKKNCELPLDLTGHGFSVPVEVSGDSLNFIFDTGASSSILYYEDSLLEEPTGTTNATNILGEQNEFPVIRIKNLSLGDNKFYYRRLALVKKHEGIGFDGIIGNDLARDFSVKFDFLNQKMILHDQPDSADIDSLHVPIWMDNRMIYTVLSFGEVSDTFLIDTGYSGFIKMKNDLYDRVVSSDSSVEWLQAYKLTTVNRLAKGDLKRKYGLVDVEVGSRIFKDQLVEADSVQQNLIGAFFFQQQSFVEFNYPDTSMLIGTFPSVTFHAQQRKAGADKLTPIEETVKVLHMQWLGMLALYFNSIGITFDLTSDKYAIVSGLRQDSTMAPDMLHLGDTLVGYDSILFDYQDLYSREEVKTKGYQTIPMEAIDSIIVYQRFTEKNNWTLHFQKNGQFLSVPVTRRIVYKTDVIHTFGHLPPEKYPFFYQFHFKQSTSQGHMYLARPHLLGAGKTLKAN